MKSTRKTYQVDRKSVCYFKFIFDGYDGIAQMKTIDPVTAKVELRIAPGCEADVDQLIIELRSKHIIRFLHN